MTSEQDQDKNVPSENLDEAEYEYVYDDEDGIYSQSDTTRAGEEAEEAAEDAFSLIGSASDDPEQQRRYMEYLSLIQEIECQNQVVEDIKAQVMELCAKPCKTSCEVKDIKRLRVCMEKEVIKLRCLMNKAIELQNFGSKRRYHEIPIATTIDEDNMAPYMVGTQPHPTSTNWKGDSSETDKTCCTNMKGAREGKAMRCLCKALGNMKVRSPEDKKLIQEIAGTLLGHKKHKGAHPCQPPCPPPFPKSKKRKRVSVQACSSDSMPTDNSLERLKQKITCMQSSVCQLKQEINRRERQKQQKQRQCQQQHQINDLCEAEKADICSEEPDPIQMCLSKRSAKADEMAKLRESYLHLLAEFSKKDCQLKEMEKRLKGFCGRCKNGAEGEGNNIDQSELILLRQRVADMKEEQIEFKCLMKEQSQQLEDYRNKYLEAQQKVEEQSVTLEKLNMNNKRIERQINTEVKEIRAKFQEKLNELLHLPKLLENEQLKLAQTCKEKEELQGKLVLVCKELKSLKMQLEAPKDESNDCRPQLAKVQLELDRCKNRLEEAERQRDLFCEQLKTTQDDLDTLRSESAKIIARTKERAETTRSQMQEQIDRLEKELAQCRASACLSVSDREAVIREMQGQLNTLSYSFDAAQKQIKTLRNHIAYVSNENCFPVKC